MARPNDDDGQPPAAPVPPKGTFAQIPDVAATAEAIGSMEVRGAARIGRHAARALGRLAEEHADDADLDGRLMEAGRTLLAARPTAVSLRNAINLTLFGADSEDADRGGAVRAGAQRYVDISLAAPERIAAAFVAQVPDGATLLTHCHSSLAEACIIEAHRQRSDIRVFADETRPWWQGHITSGRLAAAGVEVTLIVDSAAHHIMETKGVDLLVTGADTITADGGLYNKIGTRAVSLGAQSLDIPHIVAAETHKFSPYSLKGDVPQVEQRDASEVIDPGRLPKGVKVENPVFDRTAPGLVERYVTDQGVLAPSEVRAFVVDRFPIKERWI